MNTNFLSAMADACIYQNKLQNKQRSENTDFIVEKTDLIVLAVSELEDLSIEELKIVRNHGWVYLDDDYANEDLESIAVQDFKGRSDRNML